MPIIEHEYVIGGAGIFDSIVRALTSDTAKEIALDVGKSAAIDIGKKLTKKVSDKLLNPDSQEILGKYTGGSKITIQDIVRRRKNYLVYNKMASRDILK